MIPNFGSVLGASQCLSILKGHIANKEKQLEASHKLPIILWGLLALLEEFSLEFSSLHTFASHKDNYLLKSVSLEFESLHTLHPPKTHYLLLVVMLLLHTQYSPTSCLSLVAPLFVVCVYCSFTLCLQTTNPWNQVTYVEELW